MKRFVFRLESVLRIRSFELERTRMQLGVIETERNRRVEVFRNEIKQLGEEKMALKESIHHLEHEREEAQQAYDSYRSQVAFGEFD